LRGGPGRRGVLVQTLDDLAYLFTLSAPHRERGRVKALFGDLAAALRSVAVCAAAKPRECVTGAAEGCNLHLEDRDPEVLLEVGICGLGRVQSPAHLSTVAVVRTDIAELQPQLTFELAEAGIEHLLQLFASGLGHDLAPFAGVDLHGALNIPVSAATAAETCPYRVGNISAARLVCIRDDGNLDEGWRAREMWLVGKLHPMLVHFPIGLVLAAAGAEIIAIHTGRPVWRTIAVANVRAGAVMGAMTVVAGWALASAPFIEPSRLLTWHRWTGVAATASAIAAALVSTWSRGPSGRSALVYRTALFSAAAFVAIAGHLGGTLLWGADFFRP
jgi:uncharacterized membrane protein